MLSSQEPLCVVWLAHKATRPFIEDFTYHIVLDAAEAIQNAVQDITSSTADAASEAIPP